MTLPRYQSSSIVRWDLLSADGRLLHLELDRGTGRFALCSVRYDEDADDWRIVTEFPEWASRLWARIAKVEFLDGTPAAA